MKTILILLFLEDDGFSSHLYLLSTYLYPLLTTPKENHVFKPGATVNQALDMYNLFFSFI